MNFNDQVYVRLTKHGERQWAEYWAKTSPEGVPTAIRLAAMDEIGRMRFQIHELMHIFGPSCFNGSDRLPFVENKIEFE